jgi:uncharacterized RDD family membrane protein YckC
MDQPGGGQTPPPAQPPAPPPPPPQGWQSTPTPPGAPPPAGGQPGGGMPSWTNNITARGTIAGPGGVALADTPDRIIAYVIDAIIIGLIGFVLNMILGSVLVETRTDVVFGVPVTYRGPSTIASILGVVLTLAVSAGYFIYQWLKMNGQTVGMKVMKVAVRDESTGGPLTQQQAINRWLVLGLPAGLSLGYVLPVIGILVSIAVLVYYIFLLVTTAQSPTRQGWHDKFAKTVVAKVG